jgi:hypothetical protein
LQNLLGLLVFLAGASGAVSQQVMPIHTAAACRVLCAMGVWVPPHGFVRAHRRDDSVGVAAGQKAKSPQVPVPGA